MGTPGLQSLSDFLKVEFSARHSKDEFLSPVDVVVKVDSVHEEEDSSRRPRNPLVPINERMITGQRMEKRCGLEHESWIREFPEYRRLWSRHRRLNESCVSNYHLGENALRDAKDVVEGEVVDLPVHYLLNRSRSSASRVATTVIALASL